MNQYTLALLHACQVTHAIYRGCERSWQRCCVLKSHGVRQRNDYVSRDHDPIRNSPAVEESYALTDAEIGDSVTDAHNDAGTAMTQLTGSPGTEPIAVA